MRASEAMRRVAIEGVRPEVDAGRYPAKSSVGERVSVEADVVADGHDLVAAELLHRGPGGDRWTATRMEPLPNDRFRASFEVTAVGRYEYTVRGWIDRFASWRRDLLRKADAGQDVRAELEAGAALVARAARAAGGEDRAALREAAAALRSGIEAGLDAAADDALPVLMDAHPDRRGVTTYARRLAVVADRERARHGAWYELFPRSTSTTSGRPGTLRDVIDGLPYVADMGFDVLYLPPIHPIGVAFRKGPNNELAADVDQDPGSPWAIGGPAGGHTAVHPELGTAEDLDRLAAATAEHGLELALDLAFQCSPDHPWVTEHPEWFRHRPDGSIQYAENPPKRYQDIYPLDFETDDWRELWAALLDVVEFWIGHGVRLFRVDNPHTKPFAFWEWMIGSVKEHHPDVLFLSEAFTRPHVMYRLAKLGFTQSYTYFAWRTTKWELTSYFAELTTPPVVDFFRASLWPNTPDILTEQLQLGGRAAFVQRLVLAATLGANYGIYGPAFELMEHEPLRSGSEEYLHSEKYEIRHWDRGRSDSLRELITAVNRIRRENPALQQDRTLRFHPVENDALIAYSKTDEATGNVIVVVVCLDPVYAQHGWLELPLAELGIDPEAPYEMHDLMTGARYLWEGPRNYVGLNPQVVPAHVFRVSRRGRRRDERDFEYFL
jgi:starch synthase (maltosyl-transferring)